VVAVAEARTTPSRCIVLLGAPGCGKGTQARRLAGRFNVPWISTGEILRGAVAEGSELGRRVASILDAGNLVDDDTMAAVVRDRLGREDAAQGFLLDGFPRNVAQAEVLEGILADLGRSLDLVVFIDVPEDELVRRARARGRGADDRDAVIAKRLEVYREKTRPLVERYEKRGILEHVDGHQTMDAVTEAIAAKIEGSG
jgi:adenylate kinase